MLVSTEAIGRARQGIAGALSSDGTTAVVGGPGDNADVGAAWIYTVASRQAVKLVGAGMIGPAKQATSIALSANGSTAIVGGPDDNGGLGAVWVFVAAPTPLPSFADCSWSERKFSHGAQFCMAPTLVLTCDNGKWPRSILAACNTASPVDAK
jgi:hypothetical protein